MNQAEKNLVNEQESASKYAILTATTYADDRVKVLNRTDTFGIFDRWGDVLPLPDGIHGLYHRDTRYIHHLQLQLNDTRPLLLSSTVREENESLSVDLTNQELHDEAGYRIPKGSIHIRRSQFIRNGIFYEKLEFMNYHHQVCSLVCILSFSGDFRDIFEVRGLKRQARGKLLAPFSPEPHQLILGYEGLDKIRRYAIIDFKKNVPQLQLHEPVAAVFPLTLQPGRPHVLEYNISFREDSLQRIGTDHGKALKHLQLQLQEVRESFPEIFTSNEQFNNWINRSKTDLVSLTANTPHGKYPYAGVPWYNTAFGRDGLITAYETLWLLPELSRDVLFFLAAHQADAFDKATEAEPGKILHEMRHGEMVNLHEVPFQHYYGTIDATPLFVMLAGAYYERTADLAAVQKLWPHIQRAMEWIVQYGDRDGDGFLEYFSQNQHGLSNQGWKDSFDAIMHADGKLAQAPIALCEVQGYAYAAFQSAARLAHLMQQPHLAETWENKATQLKKQFNERFWDDAMQAYVLALDADKKPCRVMSSNAGQVLFTGIADPEKAAVLAKRLLQPDMFSGWGIRTLSSKEVRYNPMSYHNGSVWPHDVALIAKGLARYGHQQQMLALLTGLFDASLFIELQRLPELFCGFERRKGEGPTAYPVACSPQAWSVAAVFLLVQAMLHIEIHAPAKRLYFHKPVLPEYLNNVRIRHLPLTKQQVCSFTVYRYQANDAVGIQFMEKPEDWEVIIVQ
ncbi:amylo-alpha-1,6-glucosidase [Thermoflavifilum thermophilum]|uniref:Glycogen debranching enzyme (Alpha-1,6-glucosidase) n=1 Tax=Thermoflavifilum thermophilum TaxID=1393122 RepID=A0A1I7MXH8_9BACT|nr:amylo-alpha-1,6-glucosidase [Thermoflavifilum thermophilum]SFV27121.1 Glycogen debranching enzyme (alpha-1,6-glucosidase) [Thermoflavifilum thermophilum]